MYECYVCSPKCLCPYIIAIYSHVSILRILAHNYNHCIVTLDFLTNVQQLQDTQKKTVFEEWKKWIGLSNNC